MAYNGWKNRQTWNVALWIQNDYGLYKMAQEYRDQGYEAFADSLRDMGMTETPDHVSLNDSGLDISELDEMMAEL